MSVARRLLSINDGSWKSAVGRRATSHPHWRARGFRLGILSHTWPVFAKWRACGSTSAWARSSRCSAICGKANRFVVICRPRCRSMHGIIGKDVVWVRSENTHIDLTGRSAGVLRRKEPEPPIVRKRAKRPGWVGRGFCGPSLQPVRRRCILRRHGAGARRAVQFGLLGWNGRAGVDDTPLPDLTMCTADLCPRRPRQQVLIILPI